MIIENDFEVEAPKQDVADYLLTPDRMLYCVPGVEDVEDLGDGSYRATLNARVGPVKATFQGTVSFDGSNAPDKITATAEGKDRRTGSSVQVVLESTLSEQENGATLVANHANVTLRGRFARFGGGVIQSISQELIQDFAGCVQAELTGEQPPESSSSGLASSAIRGIFGGSKSRSGGRQSQDEEA